MTGARKTAGLGVRPHTLEDVADTRAKHEVALAPEQQDRCLGEAGQSGLDGADRIPGRIARCQWDVLDEAERRETIRGSVVRRTVGVTDDLRHPLRGRHPGRAAREEVGLPNQPARDSGVAHEGERRRHSHSVGEMEGRSVHQHDSGDARGVPRGPAHRDHPAPIVSDERNPAPGHDVGEPCLEIVDAGGERVAISLVVWLVREPAANVVGHQHTVPVPQRENEIPVVEGPGWIAVDHHDGFGRDAVDFTRAFVEIVQAQTVPIEEAPFERIQIARDLRRQRNHVVARHQITSPTVQLRPLPMPASTTRSPC